MLWQQQKLLPAELRIRATKSHKHLPPCALPAAATYATNERDQTHLLN
jgi:hypothetical protein